MGRFNEMEGLLKKTSVDPTKINFKILWILIAVGVVTFLGVLFFGNPVDAWQGLLINVVLFTGIALGALAFSAISTVTDSLWFRPLKRISEGLSFFGIYSVILFVLLFFGGKYLFEWYDHSRVMHVKEGWLNIPFFVIRQLLGYLIVAVVGYLYIRNSMRPDLGLAKKLNFNFAGKITQIWLSGFKDFEQEAEHSYKSNKYLAPWVGVVFLFVTSLIAFDWMMSLDQSWFSTMFGVQFMVSSLIGAGAVLIIISGIMRSKFDLGDIQTVDRHHDITKITFAFTIVWTYMIFAQVLVIWYANIPEETPFLILRMNSEQWGFMYWVIFFMLFIIPFFGLMSRAACRSVLFSRIVAIDILIGVWLEKYFIIVPSVQQNILNAEKALSSDAHSVADAATHAVIPGFEILPFVISLLIGVGVLGLFLYSFAKFMTKFPLLPIADNRLVKLEHQY